MGWLDSVLSDLEDMGIESFEDCCYTCGRSHARFEGLDNYVFRLESHTDVKTAEFRYEFTPEMLEQVKRYVQEHRHSVYLNEEDGELFVASTEYQMKKYKKEVLTKACTICRNPTMDFNYCYDCEKGICFVCQNESPEGHLYCDDCLPYCHRCGTSVPVYYLEETNQDAKEGNVFCKGCMAEKRKEALNITNCETCDKECSPDEGEALAYGSLSVHHCTSSYKKEAPAVIGDDLESHDPDEEPVMEDFPEPSFTEEELRRK